MLVGVAVPLAELVGRFWWPVDLFTHFRVYWCIAIVLLLALACTIPPRTKWGMIFACFVTYVALKPIAGYYLPVPKEHREAKAGTEMTLGILNVHYSSDDYQAVSEYLLKNQPDVLVLMETGADWAIGLSELRKFYPHQVRALREHAFGMWFLSKFPISNQEILPEPTASCPILNVTVNTPGGALHRHPSSAAGSRRRINPKP